MNPDTIRTLNDIKKNSWYARYQTMGEGGWNEVRKFAADWKQYDLVILDYGFDPTLSMVAKDDGTAVLAFHQAYHLDEVGYDISEKIVEFRTVETNLEPA